MIPTTFGALAMSMANEVVFGCIATTDYLPSEATLLEEYFASGGELGTKLKNPVSSQLPIRHPKDLVSPWGTPKLLLRLCQEIVNDKISCSLDFGYDKQPGNNQGRLIR